MDDRMTMFRSGMWTLNLKLSRDGRRRFHTEFLPLLHHTKSEVLRDLDNDSWYLVYIGTKPGAQGRGYARRLIEYVTEQVSDLIAGILSEALRSFVISTSIELTIVDRLMLKAIHATSKAQTTSTPPSIANLDSRRSKRSNLPMDQAQ